MKAKVGLFIPCYVDQFYPQVGIATLQLLERLDISCEFISSPVCCGQPMANAGFEHLAQANVAEMKKHLTEFDFVVCPSGSCTLHTREQLHGETFAGKMVELTEFLVDIVKVTHLKARFPHKVGMHQSCHGLRGLHLAHMSELVGPAFSKPERLLRMVEGIELIDLDYRDECCGFGGTFSVSEEAVSVKMGLDRVADHVRHGAQFITGVDMSCLMHLEGILRRNKIPIQVRHISEILTGE